MRNFLDDDLGKVEKCHGKKLKSKEAAKPKWAMTEEQVEEEKK